MLSDREGLVIPKSGCLEPWEWGGLGQWGFSYREGMLWVPGRILQGGGMCIPGEFMLLSVSPPVGAHR